MRACILVSSIPLFLPTMSLAGGTITTFSEDGSWSWFTDPRAFYEDGKVHAGYVTTDGDVVVRSLDLLSGTTSTFVLAPSLDADDHNVPAFVRTSDGRYTAFYSRHSVSGTQTQYRTTTTPGDITRWTPQASIGTNTPGTSGATYANPYFLPGEADSGLLFWRGGNWLPNYSQTAYDATTQDWSFTPARTLISNPPQRPYVKYAQNRTDRIGFAFTDGHPRDADNNIYYASIGRDTAGDLAYYKADGTKIKNLSAGALAPAEADMVFDKNANAAATGDDSWVWDLAYDASGAPVMTYATFPSTGEHQYHWARWNGSGWDDRMLVADAGGSIAERADGSYVGSAETHYSGGIVLDPTDPSIVYLSRMVDGQWELEQWKTADNGRTWNTLAITSGSDAENIRPFVPINRPADTEMVLWLNGKYDYWANRGAPGWPGGAKLQYDTDVMLWIAPKPNSLNSKAMPSGTLLEQRHLTRGTPSESTPPGPAAGSVAGLIVPATGH